MDVGETTGIDTYEPRRPVDRSRLVIGLVFIGLGLAFLADEAGWLRVDLEARWVWPVLLIGIGIAGLVSGARRSR